MFGGCFTSDPNGPCLIYCPETGDQKADNTNLIEQLNEEEVGAEYRIAFRAQERKK